jgi:N-acetylglucosamine kinase-like BadF-type ATPase
VYWLRQEGRTPREIAQLALLAEEAAAQGDEVATILVNRAGKALAELLRACQSRLPLPRDRMRAALVGGLAKQAPKVRQAFVDEVAAFVPPITLCKPLLPPIFGAVLKLWAEIGRMLDGAVLERLQESVPLLPDGWGYE